MGCAATGPPATLSAAPKASGRFVSVRASGFRCGAEGSSDGTPAKARATAQESDRTEGLDAGLIGSTQTRVAYSGTLVGTGSIGGRRQQVPPRLARTAPRRTGGWAFTGPVWRRSQGYYEECSTVLYGYSHGPPHTSALTTDGLPHDGPRANLRGTRGTLAGRSEVGSGRSAWARLHPR
jgi:hypothetical protein